MAQERTFARRELGETLRWLRQQKRWSKNFAADQLGFSRQKLRDIEDGKTRVDVAAVIGMCEVYDAPKEMRDELKRMARWPDRENGWWEDAQLPVWAVQFVQLERKARRLRIYETELVTGLTQSDAYLRATCEADTRVSDVVATFEAKRRRREEFHAMKPPPTLEIILNEHSIRWFPDPGHGSCVVRVGD